MGFRISNIHDYNTFFAIDLGSHKIKTSAYQIDEKGSLKTLGSSNIRHNRAHMIDGRIAHLDGVRESLEIAMDSTIEGLGDPPDIQDCILAYTSSEYQYDICQHEYVRSSVDTPISMAELDTMIHRIERQSFSTVYARLQKQGKKYGELRLISSVITGVLIDKKKVTNPVGFSGRVLSLSICNVFIPCGEYNIIRSITKSLDRDLISIIPSPLVYTRVLDASEYATTNTLCIDIGHGCISFVLSCASEIRAFSTHHMGFSSLYRELLDQYPASTLTELEGAMEMYIESRKSGANFISPYSSEFQQYFAYIRDLLILFLDEHSVQIPIHHILLHGSFFRDRRSVEFFRRMVSYGSASTQWHLLFEAVGLPPSRREEVISLGLARIAHDLLLIKKDPLIRILRYILYHYE